jgi:hypothetical protein
MNARQPLSDNDFQLIIFYESRTAGHSANGEAPRLTRIGVLQLGYFAGFQGRKCLATATAADFEKMG